MKRKSELQDLIRFQNNIGVFEPSIFSGNPSKSAVQIKLVSEVSISEIVDHGPGPGSQITLQPNKSNGSHLLL